MYDDYEYELRRQGYQRQQYSNPVDPFAQSLGVAIGGLAGCLTSLVGGVLGGVVNAVGQGLHTASSVRSGHHYDPYQDMYRPAQPLPHRIPKDVYEYAITPEPVQPTSKASENTSNIDVEELKQHIANLQRQLEELRKNS